MCIYNIFRILCGCSNGYVYLIKLTSGEKPKLLKQIHNSKITAICMYNVKGNECFLSADSDGHVIAISLSFNTIQIIDINEEKKYGPVLLLLYFRKKIILLII